MRWGLPPAVDRGLGMCPTQPLWLSDETSSVRQYQGLTSDTTASGHHPHTRQSSDKAPCPVWDPLGWGAQFCVAGCPLELSRAKRTWLCGLAAFPHGGKCLVARLESEFSRAELALLVLTRLCGVGQGSACRQFGTRVGPPGDSAGLGVLYLPGDNRTAPPHQRSPYGARSLACHGPSGVASGARQH